MYDFDLDIIVPNNINDWQRKMLNSSGPIITAPPELEDGRERQKRYNIGKARHDTKEEAEICLNCTLPASKCKGWRSCYANRKKALLKKEKCNKQ